MYILTHIGYILFTGQSCLLFTERLLSLILGSFHISKNMTLRQITRSLSTAAKASSALDRMHSVESYEKVLDKFAQIRACAVLRTATSETCPKAMQACIDGGFSIVEFTLTTPDCLQHLSNFRAKYDGKVMVGCGTILTIEDAAAAMDAGGM